MGAALPGGGGRGGSRGNRRVMSEINVTPLVDVMLVLLIIFMVTAPMLTAGVNVELPNAAADPVPGSDEPLSISVTRDGTVYVQETPITMEALVPRLQAITGENADARIFVRGDQQINYGKVMEVIGAIQAAGYRKVALITQPPTS